MPFIGVTANQVEGCAPGAAEVTRYAASFVVEVMDKMIQYEIETLWADSALDVAYHFDDPVLVKSGKRAGKVGRVIALFALEPVPHYIVEFSDGSSVAALEPDLERAA
ncbi:MAG: hypothetical protein ACREBG_03545 [Pyrinomonadaceae bacterium]